MLSQEQVVIVRIWSSASSGGKGVGHISLEIPHQQFYVSLWPQQPIHADDFKGMVSPVQHRLNPSFEADLKDEGRLPEQTFCLYSLNISAISAEFARRQAGLSQGGWQCAVGTLQTRYCLWAKNAVVANCASLIYELLKAGGIYDLISSGWSSSISSITTPDQLSAMLKKAKTRELRDYPVTKNYVLPDNVPILVEPPIPVEDEKENDQDPLNCHQFWQQPKNWLTVGLVVTAAIVAKETNCIIM